MKKDHAISLFSLLILVGGCSVLSPEYHQPSIEAPIATRSGARIESSTIDLSQSQWWVKMNDPVLNQLIKDGLSNNNQIQIAQANIMQAQARLKAAKYSWIPTLGGTVGGFSGSGFASNFTPQGALAGIPDTTGSNSNFNGYYGGFVPSYTVNVFQIINQTKLAQASLDMQQATINATRLSIISQISGSYFMLLGQKNQLKLQLQMIKDLQDLCQLQQLRFKNGATDLSKIADLDQEIANTQAKIPLIENSIAQTENTIQLLLNKNPGAIISNNNIDRINTSGLIPSNLSSAVLKNRPDIIMAEDKLKMANANLGLANSVFFPTISLTGILGGGTLSLSNLFTTAGGFWAGQAAANMPLLNSSSFMEIEVAKNGYYAAYFNYMQTIKSAFKDVDDSLTKQQKINQMYQYSAQSAASAQHFYNLSIAKYHAGNKDYRDVLEAKLNFDSTALSLNQAKMQQLDSLVVVYQSLAGGYASESSSGTLKHIAF